MAGKDLSYFEGRHVYVNIFHMLAFENGICFKWLYYFWNKYELVMNYQSTKYR
jgi:hypothetical protein